MHKFWVRVSPQTELLMAMGSWMHNCKFSSWRTSSGDRRHVHVEGTREDLLSLLRELEMSHDAVIQEIV